MGEPVPNDSAAPLGRREAAKRETREALLRAAREAFVEEGFDGPSLDAICARAGYTRGAFYVHFDDRDALVASVVEHALRELVEGVLASEDAAHDLETTVDRFTRIAAVLLAPGPRDAPDRIAFHQILQACGRSERLRSAFVEILRDAVSRVARAARDGQQAGSVRRDLPAEPLAELLVVLALGLPAAADLDLPLDLDAARRTALRLLGTRE